MRRLALGLALGLLFGATVPAVADAGAVSKRDRGGPRIKALDIKSVKAVGGGFGLIVKVRFKGNFQKAVGRGRLRYAAAALILRPKRGKGKPTVVATTGRGKRARTLRRTRTKRVQVVRIGKELRFYVIGAGLSSVRRLQVKSFRRLRRGARAADNEVVLDKALYEKIVNSEGSDGIVLPPPSLAEACKTLRAEIRSAVRAGRGSQTGDLGAGLLMHGCADDLHLVSSGYEHVAAGDSRVCVDLAVDPDLVPGLVWLRVFIFDDADKPFGAIFTAKDFDSNGRLRATWKITKGGKYTVRAYEVESGVGVTEIHKEITVIPPPSPSTKDCTP
jgi:hypothetical protein